MSNNATNPQHDWVIDGLLERGERVILTGFEGVGKSLLLRQIAVTCAAGIHPFTDQRQPRQRVLLVDCENSELRVHRSLRPLKETANSKGYETNAGLCTFFEPRGLNLGHQDARSLVELAIEYAPDLLVIGPLYRLSQADLHDESAALAITHALDEVRIKTGCAVIVEAHATRAGNGMQRSVSPRGSSLFLHWPDYGFGLAPVDEHGTRVQLRHWRGPREQRPWPTTLQRNVNAGWPWTTETTTREEN